MLEVKNLSKIYKAKQKNGVDTYALDEVNLRFPEKGMVFLLGKSGSGKSTLLNVCGGLDAPTSGEIIVKGRSSKDFTQSDFDSYRNTYVGFIFQEYNILNEFTVEDNIALALELQGKPKDKKAIAQLLDEVDLNGYAKRKPNTLSGGQKQRIAIARALVKSPDIIMADEPTGALDSATGKQVFDTLKKLSQDKLVIVVSHDREFAELYADRIIELKDGKILSDVTKTQEKQEAISENLTAIGDILCIKQGSELRESDFERIKKIIKNNSGDIIIAGSEEDVQNFKKINRITDNGEKEVFKNTDESKIDVNLTKPEDSKFIRSKLPARHAAKIGISGLKTKPVRLFFTVLLCVVSFVLFGTLSTLMLYNSEAMFKQTLKDSSHDFVVFDKVYRTENSYYENGALIHTYTGVDTAKFSSKEINDISNTFGAGAFGAISIYAEVSTRQSSPYWTNHFTSAAYMTEDAFLRGRLTGSYPEKSDEISVSSYFANMLVECKTVDEKGALINLTSANDLIGKTIFVGGNKFKVTGIFDSGEVDPKYEALKDNTNQDYALQSEFEGLLNDGTHLLLALSEDGLKFFENQFNYGHMETDSNRRANAYVDDGKDGDTGNGSSSFDKNNGFDLIIPGTLVFYDGFSKIKSSEYVSLIGEFTALQDNEAIAPFNVVSDSISNKVSKMREELNGVIRNLDNIRFEVENIDVEISNVRIYLNETNREIEAIRQEMQAYSRDSAEYVNLLDRKSECEARKGEYLNQIEDLTTARNSAAQESNKYGVSYEKLSSALGGYQARIMELDSLIRKLEIIRSGVEWIHSAEGESTEKLYSPEERGALLSEIIKTYPELAANLKIKFNLSSFNSQTPLTEESTYNVVAIVIPAESRDFYVQDTVYFSDKVATDLWDIQKLNLSYSETTTKYVESDDAKYTKLYVPFNRSDAQTNYLWTVYKTEEFSVDDTRIGLTGNYISTLQMIDGFVVELSTIFLYVGLVLALFAVLLFSNFITVSISQKRREIGILRAVGARSLDVFKIFFSESLVIAAICSLLSIVGSAVVCNVLNTEFGSTLGASIFVFGIASVFIILAIALLTAFIATFLPVWNAAKRKPVESIRAI